MLRRAPAAALWTLRQPRYAALAAAMLVVAVGCGLAGTWQIARFRQSVRENDDLRANARAASAPLTPGLVPLTPTAATAGVAGTGQPPDSLTIRFRTVTATGTYLDVGPQYLSGQFNGSTPGYEVVTPLRTDAGILLVVRGFVAGSHGGAPKAVPDPPAGTVTITGRLAAVSTSEDSAATSGGSTIASIDPAAESQRLGAPVYQAYVTLNPHQPGTSGVVAVAAPNLSNPAGGAYEWQHFAYIIQWYLFGLLALAAPFWMARAEIREARKSWLGVDEDAGEFDEAALDELGAAGRPALGAGSTGTLVRRDVGQIATLDADSARELGRAQRLADRYGRSLGPDGGVDAASRRSRRRAALGGVAQTVTSSADAAHRSEDAYHGAYNDYLWELALADGRTPDLDLRPEPDHATTTDSDDDQA